MKLTTARRIKRRSHLMKTAPVAADPALPEETAIAAAAAAARDAAAAPVGAGMPFRRPGGRAGGEGCGTKAPGDADADAAAGRPRRPREGGALVGQGRDEEPKTRRHGMVIRDAPCD
jgi:hypothetical protein